MVQIPPDQRSIFVVIFKIPYTVKLGNKERFDKEQIGIKKPFPVNLLLLYKDKELLALRNIFRATKKFLIAKFDCNWKKKYLGFRNLKEKLENSCS